MKRLIIATVALTTALLTTISGANAQERWRGSRNLEDINQRRLYEIGRIEDGKAKGLISERELGYLSAQQNRITNMERQALANGRIGGREAIAIHRELDIAHDDITKLLRNNETAQRRRKNFY
jgi:hypothetical protein